MDCIPGKSLIKSIDVYFQEELMAKEEKNLLDFSVELTVNGEKVALNPYVKSVFINVIFGIVKTLRNVDVPEKVDIKIKS
jgi:hypothetical protein